MRDKTSEPTKNAAVRAEPGNELPSLRELAERRLMNLGAGNLVEVVRAVVGPEPLNEQPLSIRLFVVFCLGLPLATFIWFEWLIRRLIPFWISLPLTAVTLVSYLWKRLRRKRKNEPASLEGVR